jgi:hypothetical protein
MSTDVIKEYLKDHHTYSDGDWKRLSKKSGFNGINVRKFEDKKQPGRVITVVGDGNDVLLCWDGPTLFGIWEGGMFGGDVGVFSVAFQTEAAWKAEGCIDDNHLEDVLGALYDLPDFLEGEDCENSFGVTAGTSKLDLIAGLQKAGIQHSQEITDFLQGT